MITPFTNSVPTENLPTSHVTTAAGTERDWPWARSICPPRSALGGSPFTGGTDDGAQDARQWTTIGNLQATNAGLGAGRAPCPAHHRARGREAHGLTALSIEIEHPRIALDALAVNVRRHEEQLR